MSDNLMAKVEQGSLVKTLVISLIIHAALISVFSIGNFILCAKHGTINVSQATILEEEALKEALAQKKKEEAAKKKQEAEKSKPEKDKKTATTEASTKTTKNGDNKKESKTLKELNETSKERPKASSLDSLDDDFE